MVTFPVILTDGSI